MHPVKKLICRAVQFGFRAALPILPYKDPTVLEKTADIIPLLKKEGADSVLIVTDGILRGMGMTKTLERQLWANDIRCYVYDGVCPNPTVGNVEGAYGEYVRGGCKALIAFGGGSVIDCAKAVGARAVYPKRSIPQLKGLLRVLRKTPTLFAVPTAAGSGSEAALASLITDPVKKRKYVMYNFTMIPDYAVLDGSVTYSLPADLTATIGMDALTHAVEAYIGGTTTKQTRTYCREAVKLIFENLETAYTYGTHETARKNMLYASHIAGIAFSKSYVGYTTPLPTVWAGSTTPPMVLQTRSLCPMCWKPTEKRSMSGSTSWGLPQGWPVPSTATSWVPRSLSGPSAD